MQNTNTFTPWVSCSEALGRNLCLLQDAQDQACQQAVPLHVLQDLENEHLPPQHHQGGGEDERVPCAKFIEIDERNL